jgi:hypothetical protein
VRGSGKSEAGLAILVDALALTTDLRKTAQRLVKTSL